MIRWTVAITLGIHAVARTFAGGVPPFDSFLQSIGFPPYSAFAVTAFEWVASVLLAWNKWTFVVSLLIILELGMGIALVHATAGWFVVGLGRNGVEYSVVLIACLVAVMMEVRKESRQR